MYTTPCQCKYKNFNNYRHPAMPYILVYAWYVLCMYIYPYIHSMLHNVWDIFFFDLALCYKIFDFKRAHTVYRCGNVPPAPFQKARGPSSLRIFQKQSRSPLYVVCPARAATCRRVLITSAGVTREAAGMPEGRKHSFTQGDHSPNNHINTNPQFPQTLSRSKTNMKHI